MATKVLCYNKTHPIFTCDLEENGTITKLYELIDEKHLPINMQDGGFNLEEVNKWAYLRRIPEKREGLSSARTSFRGFENYHNMFSLSDQYWFQHTQKESWKRLNFFTNSYQNETGKIFFEPWDVDTKQLKLNTPDLTTNGVLRKRWIQQENGISYLIKAGSRAYNQSPIAEVLTTMFLERLNIIPFVEYRLVVDGLMMCSICKNFIDADTEFVPLTHIYYKTERKKDESIYEHIVKQSMAYGLNEESVRHYLNSMIAADTVIHNTDRHLTNFGYIRDVESGRILGFAPLFDSGSAFSVLSDEKLQKKKAENMFRNEQKKAVSKILGKMELEDFSEEAMLQMVSAFPTLTSKEKQIIRSKVIDSAERIKKGGKRITEKEIIEDR